MKRTTILLLLLTTLCQLLGAQVQVPKPSDADFATSNLLAVYDGNTRIATICREYIVDSNLKEGVVADVLYLANADGSTNYAFGYDLKEATHYSWDLAKNSCDRLHVDMEYEGLFISPTLEVSYAKLANARNATLKPLLLTDQRGDETTSYGIVKVGAQLWMRENLATLRWRDGSAITTGLTKPQWQSTKEAAVCYYKDSINLLASHGALYNFFAVIDSRGLAPEGWTVPSDDEWHSMIQYVDPKGFEPNPDDLSRESEHAGLLLKSTEGWKVPVSPEPGAVLKQGNNLTGFNARPMGSTSQSKILGYYSAEGHQAYFWTSSTYESNALFRRFFWEQDIVNRWHESKNYGYSVRCVQPATKVEIVPSAPQVITGVQLESGINAQTPFMIRAVSKSGEIVVTDASGTKHPFTVDKSIDQLMGGVGTLVSLPASEHNGKLTISGDLIYLDLSGQEITSCQIGEANLLQALILNNNKLTQLTLPTLPELRLLYAHSNHLQSVSLGVQPQLTELVLMTNLLSKVDLSQLPALKQLGIAMNQLTELDLTHNVALQAIDCQKNKLTELHVAHLTQLKELHCSKNKIATLPVADLTQLEKLYCADNKLKTLDISKLNDLTEINCSSNELSTLDLKGKKALTELYAFTNQFTQLDLREAKALETISIGDNQLSQLALVGMGQLVSLSASFNKLSQLTLTDCPNLGAVSVFANELASISLANCPKLTILEINNNRFTDPLPLVESLPTHPDLKDNASYIVFLNSAEYGDFPEGNVKSDAFISAANKKGWVVLNGETPLTTHISEVTPETTGQIIPTDHEGCYEIVGVSPALWQVYTAEGLLVATSRQAHADNVIDLSQLPHGVYLVRFIAHDGSQQSYRIVR
ncbi:FISUMP domain-containing protein [uncultured Porphyromonas sp.]|jgi:uncharacterized protein (TIGR02145 family)|uniref:FISUMP domain-containing protein n=1 Tax=uncultured Porphyromonas sp. TaxID=159274 RepID=UPI00261D9F53|nr:FISUMP domain-containing protein [uncultured Porphyromonas sp.]